MRRFWFSVFTVGLLLSPLQPSLLAQFRSLSAKGVAQDVCSFATAPLHWKRDNWLQFAGVLGGGIAIYSADGEIRDWMLAHRSRATGKLADLSRWFGDGLYTLPALAMGYWAARRLNDSRLAAACFTAIESFFLANSVTTAGKLLGHRHRPFAGDGPRVWDGPGLDLENAHLSMPSGHTTSAFAVAAVFGAYYRHRPLVAVSAYALATLTGLSRIHDDKHWASDVWVGAAIGIATAQFLYHRHTRAHSPGGLQISARKDGIRLSWQLRF